jgi:hypothetical protein
VDTATVSMFTEPVNQSAYELAGTPTKSRRRAPQKVKPYLQRVVVDRVDAPRS